MVSGSRGFRIELLWRRSDMKQLRTSTRIWVCAVVASATGTFVFADPPAGSNDRLVFADEFNGTSLDTSKWSAASPSWTMPNSASTASASDVSEANGVLTLSANRTNASAFDSGSISSYNKFSFTSGYIESRIQLPTTPGSWPAFWGLYTGWPPEADIMEYPLTTNGGTSGLLANQYNTNYHYTNSSNVAAAGAGPVNTASSLAGTWNTFGMNWTLDASNSANDSMSFYLNGTKETSYTGSAVAQMVNMYMIMDYAVGGWPGTPSTSQWAVGHSDQVNVDWVRVWQTNPNADAANTWNVNGGGSFSTGSNWTLGAAPKYGNETAVFRRVGTSAAAQINLSSWQMFGGITFSGAAGGTTAYTIGTSSNAIQLAGTTGAGVQAQSSSTATQTINANVELWSNTTFENDMTGAGQLLVVNGTVSGAGVLTAGGQGTTVLSGSNTYTGGTDIGMSQNAAVLRVTHSAALGTGALTFDSAGNSSTARLELAGNATLANSIGMSGRSPTNASVDIENISDNNTLSGKISGGLGGNQYTIQSDAGQLQLSGTDPTAGGGAFTLAGPTGNRFLNLQGSGNGLITGKITDGTGVINLNKTGGGTWTLSASNSYSGPTVINGGTLAATIDGAFGSGNITLTNGDLTVSGGASNNYIANTATLSLAAGTLDALNYTGTDTIAVLILNGHQMVPGIYGGAASSAPIANQSALFSGLGTVTVTPEPAMLGAFSCLAIGLTRRRRRTSRARTI